MDLINKGVQLIRRSTLKGRHKHHKRTTSQESNNSNSPPSSPTITKTPSITSSITSDEGSCYSGGFNNVITPSHTRENSSSSTTINSHFIPNSITITPIISSPPQSPPVKDKRKEDSIPIIQNNKRAIIRQQAITIPDYLSSSPTKASPLSPLPRLVDDQQAVDSYFNIQPTTITTTTTATSVVSPEVTAEFAAVALSLSPDSAMILKNSNDKDDSLNSDITNNTTTTPIMNTSTDTNSNSNTTTAAAAAAAAIPTTATTTATTTTTTTTTNANANANATTATATAPTPTYTATNTQPRSPMRSHFSPRPVHVTRVSTHAVPRARANNIKQRRRQHRKLRLDDFILKRTVGTGSFGRVHLAQSKVNGKHYAIKALDKYDVVRLKQVEHINNEPTILREIAHPFLVTLWDAFQDDTHLFMVMDYVPGGELFSILRKQKKFPEQTAKFYAAEVLLALAYLHENDIVYRDLKPENILIDARGHVKLTDFGFAKRIEDVTWTVCGTPDYLAPEIILSKGYTKAVDWWGLGVLIFEMVVGRAPFVDKNPVNLYQKILECRVDWPEDMSSNLKDLLQNLLTSDIEGRYTSKEIREHPWFADTNFDQVLRRKIKPPYIPKVKDDGDTTCFAKYKEPTHLYGRIRGDPFRSKFPAF